MHRSLHAALMLALLAPLARADERTVATAIREVTVYTDRALVARLGDPGALEAGEHRLLVEGLPPGLDPASVRLRVGPPAVLQDLEVIRRYAEGPSDLVVREAQAAGRAAEAEVRVLDDEAALLAQEREFLASARVRTAEEAGGELATGTPDVEGWGRALDFITGRLTRVQERTRELEALRLDAAERVEAARRRLADLQGQTGILQHAVAVRLRLEAAAAGLPLRLEYLCSGASWQPRYDLRASADARELVIEYRGEVRQQTGEAWEAVDLTLSTAQPALGARPGEMAPIYLQLEAPIVAYGHSGFDGSGRGMAKEAARVESVILGGLVYAEPQATPERRGPSVAFRLPHPVSVPGGPEPRKVLIASGRSDSKNRHFSCPRVTPHAYVQSEVTNPFEFPLLAGEASVYFGPDFVGRSPLEDVPAARPFEVYLGVDPQVKVERTLVDRTTTRHGFFSKSTRIAYAWRTEVENHRADALDLTLLDQVPVSRDGDVTVRTERIAPEATETEEETGKLTWKLSLAPGAATKVELAYRVEWPAGRTVEGLE